MQTSGDAATLRDLFDRSPEAQERRDKESAEMQALLEEVVTWSHTKCMNRHGVVLAHRHIHSKADEQRIVRMLRYFFGDKGVWKDKQGNLEFVHMAKVFPPPTKPWEWCGDAILPEFKEWQTREKTSADANWNIRSKLKKGMTVSFPAKGGGRKTGQVIRILTLIWVDVEGVTWRCTPSILTIEDEKPRPIGLSPEQTEALKKAGLL